MQYRLLRNNIESGPFSKEALLEHGLKTTDQLKIDGDIVWKPASAFSEFKQALEIVAKPKYKFTADKKLVEIKSEKEPTAGKPTTPDNPAHTPPTGSSPFKRAPSALPKKKTGNASAVPKSQPNPIDAERTSYKREMRDEGAEPFIKQNTVHHIEHAPKMEHRRKPIPKPIKTKHRETNSNFIKEFFLPILIIGGIGCLIWWGYKKFTESGNGANTTIANATAISDSNDLSRSSTEDSQANALHPDPNENATAKTTNTPSAKAGAGNAADSIRKAQNAKKIQDSIAAAKLARQEAAQAAEQKAKAAAAEKAASEAAATAKLAAEKTADTPKTAATTPPPAEKKTTTPVKKAAEPKKTAKAPPPKTKGMNDYLDMSLNKSPDGNIRNIKIRVHNVSKEDLNIAVIEVRYYDAEGKFIKGETLQTGKIGAGKTETVKIPNSKDANRISYKVSLISGDNVYLMGN